MSTEYLNQIPNPEYPTGANVPNNTEINFYFLLYKKSFNLYFQICFLISEEKQQLWTYTQDSTSNYVFPFDH